MKLTVRALSVVVLGALAYGARADADLAEQWRLFRQMRPTLTIEITEANINTFLREHPEEVGVPPGYSNPRVAFNNGRVVVSAGRRVGFFATRLAVEMAPSIEDGRLVLRERKTGVGGISLPISFHTGVADTIMDTINGALERNDMILRRVEITRGRVKAVADVRPREHQVLEI